MVRAIRIFNISISQKPLIQLYIYYMVTQNMVFASVGLLGEKKRFVTALDLIKCLEEIR